MPIYSYSVGTKRGRVLEGSIEADNESQAVEKLRQAGYFILHLRKSSGAGIGEGINLIKEKIGALVSAEMSPTERMMFTHHLAAMLKTGVPLIEAIDTFVERKGKSRQRQMFKQIIADLKEGLPLSQSFARFPRTFSPIYTQIVASGESMGTLGETLDYLAEQLRRDHKLMSLVRSSLFYPIVVTVIMAGVLGFITFAVVPKLLMFAQNVGADVPLATQLLIKITSFITGKWHLLLLGTAVIFYLLRRFLKTKYGRRKFDFFLLSFPLLGKLTQRFHLARFSRLLGAFYHYGIAIPTAFGILKKSLPNSYYQDSVERLKEKISTGRTLSEALEEEEEKYFPRIISRVIRSAEKSATVDEALWRLADYYEEELNNELTNLTKVIEPLLMLVLGIAVVGLAMAVIVPIYKITTQLG